MNQIFPNFNKETMLNSWWGLSPVIQKQVKKLVPNKDSWSLNMTKDPSGVWTFSLPQFLTFKESMCNGTEKVMDYWFEQKIKYQPVIGSKMTVTVSKVEPSTSDTKLIFLYEDPLWIESSIYLDKGSGMDVWLCPYLQVLFKEVPESLWIQCDPIE